MSRRPLSGAYVPLLAAHMLLIMAIPRIVIPCSVPCSIIPRNNKNNKPSKSTFTSNLTKYIYTYVALVIFSLLLSL